MNSIHDFDSLIVIHSLKKVKLGHGERWLVYGCDYYRLRKLDQTGQEFAC